jgi:glycosyltransferase involved in cell wall biosynthesis
MARLWGLFGKAMIRGAAGRRSPLQQHYLPLLRASCNLASARTEGALKGRIVFVSTMAGDSWGGSEELWSRTAQKLVGRGVDVSASVHGWTPLHGRVLSLMQSGVEVVVRPARYPLWRRIWRKATFAHDTHEAAELHRLIVAKSPSLVVLSTGSALPPVDLVELCVAMKVPFVTIGQANQDGWWQEDSDAERYRKVLPAAHRCYFVSRANLRLAEKQVGCPLPNGEVVWNPFNIEFGASPAWPSNDSGEMLFASVGRLHPPSKGQDILLEAFAGKIWADRNWRLTLYGEGRMKDGLEKLAQGLGLANRVIFAGQASVMDIWSSNHVLVAPSRYEGLPLVMVEAMLCGRPVIATNVAGHSEVIDDGMVGFLADAPTVPSVAKALERFWERRTEAEQMGKAAAARIRQLGENRKAC